jgi:hypothetical protein
MTQDSFLKSFRETKSPFITNPYRFAVSGVGGWTELGRTTLESDANTITVSSLAAKKYLMVLTQGKTSATNVDLAYQLNADTGANYTSRQKWNGGGSDYVLTGQTHYRPLGTTADLQFLNIEYITNISDKEKLIMGHGAQLNATGAGDTITREEHVAKWANTSSSINQVNAILANGGAGRDYRNGTEIVVLGWDPDDTHTSNFWEELASVDLSGGSADIIDSGTISAKKYLWVQAFLDGTGEIDTNFQFNSDTGSNYSNRRSASGGADGTGTSKPSIDLSASLASGSKCFQQAFIINNSANEKLVIAHNCTADTAGAGTAPIRDEVAGKWANTSSSITSVQIQNSKAGSYDTGTIMKVWGSD